MRHFTAGLLAVLAAMAPAPALAHLPTGKHLYSPLVPLPLLTPLSAPVGAAVAPSLHAHHGLTLVFTPLPVVGAVGAPHSHIQNHVQAYGSPLKIFFTRFPPVVEGWVNRIQNHYSTYLLGQGIFPQDIPPVPQPPLQYPAVPAIPATPAIPAIPAVPAFPISPTQPPAAAAPLPPLPAAGPGGAISPALQPFPQETPSGFPTFSQQPAADASNNTATSVAVAGADGAGASVPFPAEASTEAVAAVTTTTTTTTQPTTTSTTTATSPPFVPEQTPYPEQRPDVQPSPGPYHYPPPHQRLVYPASPFQPLRSFRPRSYY